MRLIFTRHIKAHICRVQLTSPLKSEHSEKQDKQVRSEKQDKQVRSENSQNNTENNIVNETESSSDKEDNKSDLQMHDILIGNGKSHPYPTAVMKQDSNDS